MFGVELRIVDDDGKVLPRDGKSSGRLQTRGPAVVKRYFKQDEDCVDADNWFDTGDIAVIHPDNTIRLTDRAKDVIKSGGEWISSIELENAAVGCPGRRRGGGDRHSASQVGRAAAAAHRPRSMAARVGEATSATSCRTRSRNGGCPTRSSSSTSCRTPRPASSARRICATSIAITASPMPRRWSAATRKSRGAVA